MRQETMLADSKYHKGPVSTRWLMAAMLPGPMLARALLRVASWGRIIARLWVARSALRVSTRWVIASSRVVTPLLRMAPLLRVATTAAAAPWIAGGCAIAAALYPVQEPVRGDNGAVAPVYELAASCQAHCSIL